MDLSFITPELKSLRDAFRQHERDIKLVGGVVRDVIAGEIPSDIDLCTDATPNEQIEIFKANNLKFVETGIDHGTVTVFLDDGEQYEITTLRTDTETDGRHATVEFTTDWIADLARRDFTFNAMNLTFEGELTDPFGGVDDLAKDVVRFVGNAEDRIKEDFLRLMRWYRFMGRFGEIGAALVNDFRRAVDKRSAFRDKNYEKWETERIVTTHMGGIDRVSRERIWAELKKILAHSSRYEVCDLMLVNGFTQHIGLGNFRLRVNEFFTPAVLDYPEVLVAMTFGFNERSFLSSAKFLKMSNLESRRGMWFCQQMMTVSVPDYFRLIAVDNAPREWVFKLAELNHASEEKMNWLTRWSYEPFPVTGHDIMKLGFTGKEVGAKLTELKDIWAEKGYSATKEELLELIEV